ncbi:hypothetical protein CLAFUW4_07069 [Fulvia fulva]|uniref:Uncharacterized protein n=1 Tax=Passalora fulva TaxID=5499 RepID=A0A9Q8PB74_PASFU|nr:uncharacterized protein CLAFUR5_07205 [Fulvia fulva]KAK4622078.1 hypothetical protein CLAFUR4_07078 [Fulvia fulva]KAK4623267.1 hypothetical protein CLAFUR0_07076 [Fulvia fulva]UJO19217.1 hypothetical protein CLAFUR5_07205 [Fulvia fulva]WPV16223.1 hypothetical protein CLAFUW4_07069 [Fulvia fulva]WPV30861.1 hypothetical protein CLAFUW7_07069 [Fulvia fulva]
MIASLLFGLCLAKTIVAAPAPAQAQTFDVTPAEDDVVVLLEDGNHMLINYTTWVEKLTFEGFSLTPPELDPDFLNFTGVESPKGNAQKRDDASCENTKQMTLDKTERFVDWDIQMSNVVCATGAMDIFVMSGWSVANSVTISGGLDLGTWLKGKLGPSVGVDFGRAWISSQSAQNKGTVRDGNCGVMITKPLTTRRSGRILQGCLGATTQIATWYADDHGTGSYNGVSWIAGAVGMCTKPGTEPPLTRCKGQGEFV